MLLKLQMKRLLFSWPDHIDLFCRLPSVSSASARFSPCPVSGIPLIAIAVKWIVRFWLFVTQQSFDLSSSTSLLCSGIVLRVSRTVPPGLHSRQPTGDRWRQQRSHLWLPLQDSLSGGFTGSPRRLGLLLRPRGAGLSARLSAAPATAPVWRPVRGDRDKATGKEYQLD